MAFDSSEVAWRDITLTINGQIVGKATRIKVKTTRETEYLYGGGDEPFDINPGNKAYPGELELYQSVKDTMNDIAIAAGYDDLTDLPWNIGLCFKKTSTSPKRNITYPGCRFEEFEEGGENNGKSMKTSMPFKSLKPIRA